MPTEKSNIYKTLSGYLAAVMLTGLTSWFAFGYSAITEAQALSLIRTHSITKENGAITKTEVHEIVKATHAVTDTKLDHIEEALKKNAASLAETQKVLLEIRLGLNDSP
jgi:hypothetical protein